MPLAIQTWAFYKRNGIVIEKVLLLILLTLWGGKRHWRRGHQLTRDSSFISSSNMTQILSAGSSSHKTVWRAGKLVDSILEVEIADLIKFHQIKNQLHFCQAQGQRQTSKLEPEVRSVMGWSDDGQVVKWRSVESQVKVKSQSELDIGGRETCDY